jgi:hypothetical protein
MIAEMLYDQTEQLSFLNFAKNLLNEDQKYAFDSVISAHILLCLICIDRFLQQQNFGTNCC